MHAYPNGYFHNPSRTMPTMESIQNRQSQTSENAGNVQQKFEYTHMRPQYKSNSQNLQQQMFQVERQLSQLIRLIEENNRLLRSMQQQQQRVVTSGGGAVIVRM